MNDRLSELLHTCTGFVWEYIVFVLVGAGLYLLVRSGLAPFRGFFHAIRLVSGRFHHDNEEDCGTHQC